MQPSMVGDTRAMAMAMPQSSSSWRGWLARTQSDLTSASTAHGQEQEQQQDQYKAQARHADAQAQLRAPCEFERFCGNVRRGDSETVCETLPPPPPPAKRTFFERLFRGKTSRTRSPSETTECTSATENARSMPARPKAYSTPCEEPEPTSRVLMEGVLTKLSTHKYWHRHSTFFVLEEEQTGQRTATGQAGKRICLREYRKYEHARRHCRHLMLHETILGEFDEVADISDRQIKHGFELLHQPFDHDITLATESSLQAEPEVWRYSAANTTTHLQWVRVLECAITRIISDPCFQCSPKATLEGMPSDVYASAPEEIDMDAASASAKIMPISSDEEDEESRRRERARTQDQREAISNGDAVAHKDSTNQDENDNASASTGSACFSPCFPCSPIVPADDGSEHSPRDNNAAFEDVNDITHAFENAQIAPSSMKPAMSSMVSRSVFSNHDVLFQPIPRGQVRSFSANGQVFTLHDRYTLLKCIGNGAYGAVIAASDAATTTNVAIKKITNVFDDLVDAKRILREVRLLHHFHHKNITALLDLAPPSTRHTLDDVYIVTELMETDLHQVIYSMQPMSDDHIKYFLYQMLCALFHIHSAGVLHRDMKPSNVLLNANCDLKICDFGLARGGMADEEHEPDLTEYVVTRWYRAPEIMLNCLHYTSAIDVWSVGCIFAEMLLREPLFPGNDYIHQLKLIIKVLGTPKQEDVAFVKNLKALRFLTKLPIAKPQKWRDIFASVDDVNPQALDLLNRMLTFNPDKRISVQDALRHPYLAAFYDAADVIPSPLFDFRFDLPDDVLTKQALTALLAEDIAHFHPVLTHPTSMPTRSNARYFSTSTTA